jgi:hypothetical protein
MAMTHRQTAVIFWIVVLAAIAFVILEIYLVVELTRDPGIMKGVLAVVDGLAIASTLSLVNKGWENEFLSGPLITGKALHECFHNRFEVVHALPAPNNDRTVSNASASLVRAYLRMLENLLAKKVGKHDFELSVFCDAEEPKIVAYYDSSSRIWPRSHVERTNNPLYYVEKKYEVVALLRNPVAQFIVKSNLEKSKGGYEFVTAHQKRQIKSTILHVISAEWPAAIVVTCSKAGAFQEDDEVTKELVRGLGSAILVDLHLSQLWTLQNNAPPVPPAG